MVLLFFKTLQVLDLFTGHYQAIQIYNLKHKYMHKIRIMYLRILMVARK
jgi:hypothetical protein